MADDSELYAVASPSAAGDFEVFVRTETASLLRTASLIAGDAAAAEDLVQETLTRLYPKWSRVQGARFPLAYVRRSMINTYVNARRSKASREVVSDQIVNRATLGDATDTVADHDFILQLLRELPDRQRAALVLTYLDDLPAAEVARILGCRVGTARSLVSRGLSTIRDTMTRRDDHG